MRYASPLIAAALTVFAGAILFAALGRDPVLALHTFFITPISDFNGLAELTLKATPLVLCGIGLSIGFRGNVWNIGAEGQFIMGAICSGGVALAFYGDEGPWLLPLMMLAGILGGAGWGAIPALCRTRFNANEILVSLMLSYVALQVLGYLVHGPWRDPDGYNFPETRLFNEEALIPVLAEGTRLYASIFAALAAVGLGWLVMAYSFLGFRIKVVGQALAAARYAGFSPKGVVWTSFLVSGGLAGLAGFAEAAGPVGQLNATFPSGYGFAAIIVAFLGRLHPMGVLLAGLLLALTYLGGEALQADLNLPRAVTGVFQGMLLFFVLASDVLIRYRIRFGGRLVRAEP
ncbi:MAG: ABC transporter permease [Alphaproteobacteria bacterium]|nr:ABC transporter permease [Alphaproteobacteria bacterium]